MNPAGPGEVRAAEINKGSDMYSMSRPDRRRTLRGRNTTRQTGNKKYGKVDKRGGGSTGNVEKITYGTAKIFGGKDCVGVKDLGRKAGEGGVDGEPGVKAIWSFNGSTTPKAKTKRR